ncbi:hypothetical protein CR203_14020 [Salipaludibacillus neizhouensis]|uniref:Glycoside hydrolase 35 catalytic domain-containing protein n=1 Tax=Salipaludibacillus neizhouensis TaxID=885475 RepID=A0A3A9K6A0_9BACI|nr:beta-galactosidase [Salipaludibacillus neizhouensis]RKL66938.1 hypothetical protein CR203_14020 [Salipaludibacillus neizhouensis]
MESILIINRLLCSSLFYFRIPNGLWQDRLRKVKDAGYNCIDVYFPWNFHEMSEGDWDFNGDKDIKTFLKMAADEGLWVVARPGPYICSEWDGGGLPSYLYTDRNMVVRDNDSRYLDHVSRWFDQVIPVLKKFEQGHNGSIIAIQLENEMDFYHTKDREGYISALRDMAEKHHISVPLFACAGQGDLYGATGFTERVMPACNFYPNDKDPNFESIAYDYYEELQQQNYPLCVTETNRTHFFLRRLLSVGTKLLGPYNQVSGTDFGFTNSINNWGDPVAFLTSDYDFGGMVSPEGLLRKEHSEGRLLGQFINAFGSSLAEAKSQPDEGIFFEPTMLDGHSPYSLQLVEGGKALFLPNTGDVDQYILIRKGTVSFPVQTVFKVPVCRCQIVLYDVPLATWACPGTLKYSTAELGLVKTEKKQRIMIFHTEDRAEISLKLPKNTKVDVEDMEVAQDDDTWIFSFSAMSDGVEGAIKRLSIGFEDGTSLVIFGMSRANAAMVSEITSSGGVKYMNRLSETEGKMNSKKFHADWTYIDINEREWLMKSKQVSQPLALEDAGYFRGYGWYSSLYLNDQSQHVEGVLLHKASDVVSLYCNSVYEGTSTPGGGFVYYPLKNTKEELDFIIRTEIWGHTNFHSPLLPALSINALKGIDGLTVVHKKAELGKGWSYLPLNEELSEVPVLDMEDAAWKKTNYDVFLTSAQPKKGYYHKKIVVETDFSDHILHFEGIESLAKLFIDGEFVEYVNPLQPYVSISEYLDGKQSCTVVVYLEQYYGESGGIVSLLSGNVAHHWSMYGMEEQELVKASKLQSAEGKVEVSFPFKTVSGQMGWLSSSLKFSDSSGSIMMFPKGKNVKLSIFFNDRLVGRVWLPSKSRPEFRGGGQYRVYLPSTLANNSGNQLHILTEAIEAAEGAVLEGIEFREVIE